MNTTRKEREFVRRLLDWFKNTPSSMRTAYPWRSTSDPYQVLIAEIMLRKTTRTQVLSIYPKFMEKFPTIQHLASAQIKEVERVITPLGLERKRAELLKKLAKQLIERYKGRVPSDREELMQLPCIGRYTANAILCFAFGLSVPLVDTNVARVINRIFSVPYSTTSRTHIQNMWKFMERIVPRKEAKEFNLAIIDFANVICRSKNPKHEYCIVKDICNWYFNHLKHKTEVGSSSLGI